ncbi:MAG: type II toxin-antitoxin system HicB family antitoxin [Chitinophagaceae bacterium]|jgi:predicted HicB family RNase H-like nuclease|nr:type II toxin-antitoxin system HicB family antitoxin [Chitinophagaceae bacterium]
MEKLEYKGYSGSIEYSKEDKCLYGKVRGIDKGTCITYEGNTAAELYEDFKGAIDDYLDYCKDKGITPKKSYSGSLNIRIPSEIHGKVAMYAESHGTSINAFIRDSIEKQLETIH